MTCLVKYVVEGLSGGFSDHHAVFYSLRDAVKDFYEMGYHTCPRSGDIHVCYNISGIGYFEVPLHWWSPSEYEHNAERDDEINFELGLLFPEMK